MAFGMHLRELSRLRVGIIIATSLALLAAVASVAKISVLPPKLTSRSVEMSTAYTQVVVDTPNSALLDLRQGTDDINSLKNRAVIVGTVAASPPVARSSPSARASRPSCSRSSRRAPRSSRGPGRTMARRRVRATCCGPPTSTGSTSRPTQRCRCWTLRAGSDAQGLRGARQRGRRGPGGLPPPVRRL